MKPAIFFLFLISFAMIGYGQLNETYKNKALTPTVKKPGFKLSYNNTIPPGNRTVTEPKKQLRNQMPVLKLSNKGVLKGNNGKGADIYVYEPDNMPCLKPDSTFHSNMPTGKLTITKH